MTKPVAWMYNDEIIYSNNTVKKMLNNSNGLTPLYKKQEWQGLDENEFIYFTHWVDADTLVEIEQALKEKNT